MTKANEKSTVFAREVSALDDAQCLGVRTQARALFDAALDAASSIATACATAQEAADAIEALRAQPWQNCSPVYVVEPVE